MSASTLGKVFRGAAFSLSAAVFSVAHVVAADRLQGEHWTGAIRCEINVTADGYAHQETQTWTLTGATPKVDGAYEIYDATWSVTGEGWHDRPGQTARRVAKWTANAPGSRAPVAFFRPARGRLVVQTQHGQLSSAEGYAGTEQYINNEGPSRPERPLAQRLFEWTSWKIEPSATDTQLTGSSVSKVSAGIAPLHPGDAQVTITLTWALGRGKAPAMPPSTLPPLARSPGSDASERSRVEGKRPLPELDRTNRAPGGASTPSDVSGDAPPAAQLLSIDPASVQQGANEVQVRLVGQGTRWRRETTMVDFGPDIRVAEIFVNSPTDMTAVLQVSSSASPGPRAVRLTTPVSGAASEIVGLPDRFAVEAVLLAVQGGIFTPLLLPAITQVSPDSGVVGSSVPVTITGRATHFAQGATSADFGAGITVESLAVTSPTSATATLRIDPSATIGPRMISVTTGAETASPPDGFSVNPIHAPPSVVNDIGSHEIQSGRLPQNVSIDWIPSISLSTRAAALGSTNVYVMITGHRTNFVHTVTTVDFGPGVDVQFVEVPEAPLLAKAVLNIAPNATPGPRTVTVTTGNEVVTLVDGFTVTGNASGPSSPEGAVILPAPDHSEIQSGRPPQNASTQWLPSISLSTSSAVRGSTNVYVMITGNRTNFEHTVTTVDFGPGVAVEFVEVPEAPLLAKAVVSIALNAIPGPRTVTVTTRDEVVALANGFLVRGAATPPQAANDQFSVRRDRKLVAGAVVVSTFNGLAVNVEEDDRFARAGSRVFFYGRKGAENGLWWSDGTPDGTRFVTAMQQAQNLTGVGNRVFFTAPSAGHGQELWISDGTASGTALVKDITPGPDSSSFLHLYDASGTLYFVIAAAGAQQLWRSDGTAAGTVPIKTNISITSAHHVLLSHAGGSVFFVANERLPGSSVVERWLWKSDGTAAGTVKICEMKVDYSGAARESTKPIRGVGNHLFLLGNPPGSAGAGGPDLWRSDGTTQGTVKILDVNPNPTTDVRSVIDLVAVNDALFFTVLDCVPSATWEIWRSDGTANGTVLVKAGLSAGNYSAKFPMATNGMLYFSGGGGGVSAPYGLWKCDGTAAGTTLVKATCLPFVPWHVPANQAIVGADGMAFFHGDGQLWKSDGTAAGTVLVRSTAPTSLTEAGGTVFYCAPWNTLWAAGPAAPVTSNDTGPTAVPLKVALVSGPAHGALTLREDGSFIYQPNTGYAGTDQFTYTASDGADVSSPATVAIQVVAQ